MAAAAEPLTDAAQRIAHAWKFCGGWRPDLLLLYDAIYGVTDWELLIDGLSVIRDGGLPGAEEHGEQT